MRTKLLVLIVTALLIQQSACGRLEKKLNGGYRKLHKPQQRSSVGEARFTTEILNKLSSMGKLSTTTEGPAFTSVSYVQPIYTSDFYPTGSITSASSALGVDPESSSASSAIGEPESISSGTSALGPAYIENLSSPTPGDNVVTNVPEEAEQSPSPDNVAPGNNVLSEPISSESVTSFDDDAFDNNDEKESELINGSTYDAYNENDNDNDNENGDFVSYNAKSHLNIRNDLDDNLQIGRSSRTRPSSSRRNQLRRRRNQQPNRRRLRAQRNRVNSQRRRQNPSRRRLTRRQEENLRGRRRSSQRRRLLRRRSNARRNAQRQATLKRRNQIRRRNNRNQITNNPLRRYTQRPVQRIIIRGV